jgi:hypothetical protein
MILPAPLACDCSGYEEPVVETRDATNITSISVTLNGNLKDPYGQPSAFVGFRWGTGPSPSQMTNQTDLVEMTSAGPFSADLHGLIVGTTYYFYAYGEHRYGPGKDTVGLPGWGDTKSFYIP